jgi:hypothetical protein
MSLANLNGSATARPTNKQIWQQIGWIKDRIHPFSWHRLGLGSWFNQNPERVLKGYLNGERPYYKSMPQWLVRSHVNADETIGFTGRDDKPTILMVDIDNHKAGSYEGAVSLAIEINRRLPVDCHFERSTNGKGVHLYLLLDPREWRNIAHYNWFVKKPLQEALNRLAQTFDVEFVEIKGTIPYIQRGKINAGQPAKLPRCLDRERFGDEKRLRQEFLDAAGASYDAFIFLAQFIDAKNRDDVL